MNFKSNTLWLTKPIPEIVFKSIPSKWKKQHVSATVLCIVSEFHIFHDCKIPLLSDKKFPFCAWKYFFEMFKKLLEDLTQSVANWIITWLAGPFSLIHPLGTNVLSLLFHVFELRTLTLFYLKTKTFFLIFHFSLVYFGVSGIMHIDVSSLYWIYLCSSNGKLLTIYFAKILLSQFAQND